MGGGRDTQEGTCVALRMTGPHLQTGERSEGLWALCYCYQLCQGRWETLPSLPPCPYPTNHVRPAH